ncbi:MAG: hypothetical protein JXX29_10595 [Deltaproteobacteria bacterium]|nr:hypothetical protein [Deltaproteobacteria bacterium]MBN2672116.1 hypothetical protein [Deltaproteobacteria bacterium]
MKKSLYLIFATITVMSATAVAHEIHTESEYAYAPITQPNNAKSIVAYLDEGDMDVFQVLVTPEDMPNGMALITGNVLPPACIQYKNFYPNMALVGYGLPEPTAALPANLPPGMGAIVVPGRRVKKDARPIYTTTEAEMNHLIDEYMDQCADEGIDLEYVYGEVSWFLPHGVTQECLHCTPWACPMDDTLFTPVFVPGIYEIWVWNDTDRPGDYNLSLGIGEAGETCAGIQHTSDLYRQIVGGELLEMSDCVSAGTSGFEVCEEPVFF